VGDRKFGYESVPTATAHQGGAPSEHIVVLQHTLFPLLFGRSSQFGRSIGQMLFSTRGQHVYLLGS
jgi:hypothetical protein